MCVLKTSVRADLGFLAFLAVHTGTSGANGGCQTPYLVISACAVAETALASTPPSTLGGRVMSRRDCVEDRWSSWLPTAGEMCRLLQVDIGHALVGLPGGSRTAPRGCMVVAQHPRGQREHGGCCTSPRAWSCAASVCAWLGWSVRERIAGIFCCGLVMIVGRVWRGQMYRW